MQELFENPNTGSRTPVPCRTSTDTASPDIPTASTESSLDPLAENAWDDIEGTDTDLEDSLTGDDDPGKANVDSANQTPTTFHDNKTPDVDGSEEVPRASSRMSSKRHFDELDEEEIDPDLLDPELHSGVWFLLRVDGIMHERGLQEINVLESVKDAIN